MNPEQVWAIVMLSIGSWTVVRVFKGPLGDAIARRIGGAPPSPEHNDQLIADLQARVAELEERLEFTERVLLQERQAGQLRQGES